MGILSSSDGKISIDNVRAILALEMVEKWIGTITPEAVLGYTESDTRALLQAGNVAFMRDGHAAAALSEPSDSPIHGKVGIVELPVGPDGEVPASTLGGWTLGVSRYSSHRDEAIALIEFLASAAAQKKYEALELGHLPAISALYQDADLIAADPDLPLWRAILAHGVLRPAPQTRASYRRVSEQFWTGIQNSMRQEAVAEDFLQSYRFLLEWMQRSNWRFSLRQPGWIER